MYSIEGLAAESPHTPNHIATFLFPLLHNALTLPSIKSTGSRHGSGGYYNGKIDSPRPFTTARGASILIVDLEYLRSPSSVLYQSYRMFIHPSAFRSHAMTHVEIPGTSAPLPEVIPWASWGPRFTRLLDYETGEMLYGYNVGYYGKQYNFNALDSTLR